MSKKSFFLIIFSLAIIFAKGAFAYDPGSWQIELKVQVNGASLPSAVFGVKEGASEGYDSFDEVSYIPLPPYAGFYSSNPNDPSGQYKKDIRTPVQPGEKKKWDLYAYSMQIGFSQCKTTISWADPSLVVPEEYSLTLTDLTTGKSYDMKKMSFYEDVKEGNFYSCHFQIVVSSPRPDILILPKSHDFGRVTRGNSSAPQVFTISNVGNLELAIGTVTLTGTNLDEFKVQNNNCQGQKLAPQASCAVEVIFSPFSDGLKSANLTIISNDPRAPTFNVGLSGEGKVPTPPEADFKAVSDTSGCAPLEVRFKDMSSGDITSYWWDFNGDGKVDVKAKDPTWTYEKPGTYTVCLTAFNNEPYDTETKAGYITVKNCIRADFSASLAKGCAPCTVTFSDLSTGDGNIVSWYWDFGDQGDKDVSSDSNPTYTYTKPGEYMVSLIVTAADGTFHKHSKEDYISVYSATKADFISPGTGYAPLEVTFRSTSEGATSYLWNFGDGDKSTAPDPIHTYNQSGDYGFSLTASGPCGEDTKTETIKVLVDDTGPTVSITSPNNGANTTVYKPSITIKGLSTDSESGLKSIEISPAWPNSNSLPEFSFVNFPSLQPGDNLFMVTATDKAGNTSIDSITITYSPLAEKIIINEVAFNEANDWIELKVVETGDYSGYRIYEGGAEIAAVPDWGILNAGDFIVIHEEGGTNDTVRGDNNPAYWDIYGANSLTGTDNIIQIKMPTGDDRRVDVVIYSNKNGNFTASKTEANEAVARAHWDAGSDFTAGKDSDAWTDSDEVSSGKSLGRNPYSTDTNSRVDWEIKLWQTKGADNNEDDIPPVVIITSPNKGNSATTSQSQITISGSASDTGTGVLSVLINTGEANTGDVTNFSFLVTLSPGENSLTVTAKDRAGNIAKDTIIVTYSPVADFTADKTYGCAPLEVCFKDSSFGEVVSWSWDLDGDGMTDATVRNPCYTYEMPGIYTVSLTVTGVHESDTMTRTDYVVIRERIKMTRPSPGDKIFGDAVIIKTTHDLGAKARHLYRSGSTGQWQEIVSSMDIVSKTDTESIVTWNTTGLLDGEHDLRVEDMSGSDSETITVSLVREKPDYFEDEAKKDEPIKISDRYGNGVQAPAGALGADDVIRMKLVEPPAPPLDISPAGSCLEVTLEITHQTLNKDITISMSYQDEDDDSMVDGVNVLVDSLAIYVYNESTGQWDWLESAVDRLSKVVRAEVGHLSVFGLFGKASEDFSDMLIFPNPCRMDRGDEWIMFTHLPSNFTIRIYNIARELVRFQEEVSDSFFSWDIKNDDGRMVSPGVYIYCIEKDGRIKKGKIAVIR
ncbi:PKD domain-containing protein [bacterium]|nr:PKD domain-containing protein [bacterium]